MVTHLRRARRAQSTQGVLAVLATCCCTLVRAGAPFQTDDPEPVALHHTEVNLAVQGTRTSAGSSGVLVADVNHGCAAETQCHVAVPTAFNRSTGSGWQSGLGDVEIGFKYRFFHSPDDGWMAAIYPTAFLPTGNASRGLGNGSAQVLLPLWLQKSAGAWTWDAGAGYLVNHAADARSSWFLGLLAQRSFGDRLKLGGEIFHRTPTAQGVPPTTGFNLGATVKLNETRNFLFSVGRGLQGTSANRFSLYAAYQMEL